jgi:hypothetical protein
VLTATLPEKVSLHEREIPNPLDAQFANGLRLVGYDVQPEGVGPDGRPASLKLTTFWRSDAQTEPGAATRVDLFAHLADASGVWQTLNGILSEDSVLAWLPTDRMVQDVRVLEVPPEMPRGKAHFEVGLYRRFLMPGSTEYERVPVVDREGRAVADRVDLGAVMVGELPPQADLSGLRPLAVQFDDRVELVGWKARADSADPSRLLVDLGWRALGRSDTDYTAFVHLLDQEGQIASQVDGPPGGLANPTTRWVPDETVRTAVALSIPPGKEAEDYTLRVGLYEPVSGRQLPITGLGGGSSPVPGQTFLVFGLGDE